MATSVLTRLVRLSNASPQKAGVEDGRNQSNGSSRHVGVVGGKLIRTSENQKSWLWRHCRRRATTDYSDHPRKLVTLNPKPKSTGAGRYQLLSRWWDAYRKQLGLKDFSPKSQDAVALQQIGGAWRFTYDWSQDIRQAIDRCSNIWLHRRALVMVSLSIRLTAWLQKFKEAGGTVREIYVHEQSHRDYSAWLSASSFACHGLLITRITPLPTKPSATKSREPKLMNANYWHADASAWCYSLDAKYTKELADASRKWCSAWWCCCWSSSVAHQQSVSQCVKPPPPPAWIMQPPDWQTPLNGIISPSERGWSLCKNNWRNSEVY